VLPVARHLPEAERSAEDTHVGVRAGQIIQKVRKQGTITKLTFDKKEGVLKLEMTLTSGDPVEFALDWGTMILSGEQEKRLSIRGWRQFQRYGRAKRPVPFPSGAIFLVIAGENYCKLSKTSCNTSHSDEVHMFISKDDLCFLPATQLAADLRSRKVTPIEVVDALADRIKRPDPKLNAYVTPGPTSPADSYKATPGGPL
jgi:hypothetical protein